MMDLKKILHKIPNGYSVAMYKDSKYGLTRTNFNAGRSIKIYAEALGGTDFVSLNIYFTTKNTLLKPCEMPQEKVLNFLNNCKIIDA